MPVTGNGRFLAQQRLPAFGSDHHAAVATIANRAGAAAPVDTTRAATAPSTAALPATLTVPGRTLTREQIEIAATAIEVGSSLTYGDRDSVGPWQMRPSQGWGTVEQIRTLTLGARAFYGLAEHTNNPGLGRHRRLTDTAEHRPGSPGRREIGSAAAEPGGTQGRQDDRGPRLPGWSASRTASTCTEHDGPLEHGERSRAALWGERVALEAQLAGQTV